MMYDAQTAAIHLSYDWGVPLFVVALLLVDVAALRRAQDRERGG